MCEDEAIWEDENAQRACSQEHAHGARTYPSFSVLSLVKAWCTLLAPTPGVIPDALVNNL
jgi:hypothetical protein